MLCSRCVLPLLALYMSLEEHSAAVLPDTFRNQREVSWPDEGLFQRLEDRSDPADLPVGDAEEMGREVKSRPSQSETILAPMEYLSRQNQHQYHHKASEKRRKVAPLDSISSFQMSTFRRRSDEPERHWEDYRD